MHGEVIGGMQSVKTIYEEVEVEDEDGHMKIEHVPKTIDVTDKGATPPVLAATLKHRYDGVATIRFENDCPARDALKDSEVGDVWRISLYRTRKIKPREKNVVDFRDSQLSRAFGGPQDPRERRRYP
jgi:hypothetical protein